MLAVRGQDQPVGALLPEELDLVAPRVSQVGPRTGGASAAGILVGLWSFSIIAGGALVVAGTDQLASVLAGIRSGRQLVSPVLRVLHDLPADVVLAIGVVPDHGRPIPELVIGEIRDRGRSR